MTKKKSKLAPDEFDCLGKTHRMPVFIPDVPNEYYHGAHLKQFIGHSGLVKLVSKTPAHFLAYQQDDSQPTQAMEFGSAAHIFMLEDPKDRVRWCDLKKRNGQYVDRSGEQFSKWKDKVLDDEGAEYGIFHHEWKKLEAMKKVLYRHSIAKNLIVNGEPELSAFFMHDKYDGVKCKIRVDFMFEDPKFFAFVDYKTCRDSSPVGFAKAAYEYGYDLQAYFYRLGGFILKGRWPHFFFIAQEKDPPYAVAVYVANNFEDPSKNSDFTTLGEIRTNKALGIYWKCIQNPNLFNEAYPERTLPIVPPNWAYKEWPIEEKTKSEGG
jgi:hypothetical protein